ncbi:MAG TPA: hypothetical protein VIG74_04340 [Alphaproteobacteria bacterium]|jgi:hypothetical protein
MRFVSRFLNYLTSRTEIHDLAEKLHLRSLPDYVDMDTPQLLTVTLWDRYNINYVPRNVVDIDKTLLGAGRQTLKKAFEIAVVSRDNWQDSVSVIYREESPGHYAFHDVELNADCCHLRDMMKDTDCTMREIMKTIERNVPSVQRCEF